MTGLRVRVHAEDKVRRQGLVAMLQQAGHLAVDDAPDVELCDTGHVMPLEAEAPVLGLGGSFSHGAAGLLDRNVTAEQLDAGLRAVAVGLLVRSAGLPEARGFTSAEDIALLTPREREILALIGERHSNKALARRLGISVHTVEFHIEALFAKLEVTSRAEAVAKGLRGGVIEL